jgi:alpha-L-arabinofuranosidase
MIGMERNSDMVTMSSYAPLIENNNLRSWPTNMIWVKNEGVVGRSSYYVQQLFANHLPDYNLQSTLVLDQMQVDIQGRVGLGTWETQAVYKNFSIKKHDESEYFYQGDFVNQQSDWEVFRGNWNFSDNTYIQQSMGTRCISMMNEWMYNDCVIEVQAKKTGGSEGFLIVLDVPADNLDLHYQVNLGGWGNSRSAIEIVRDGVGSVVSESVPFKIANDQWYDIKVVVKNGSQITCYVDGEYIMGVATNPTGKIQAIAGYDEEKGEAVIKVVNGTTAGKNINIKLNNKNIEPNGKVITLRSPILETENSFSNPTLISPKETDHTNFSSDFNYLIRPTSVTVFRIKCDKEADGDMVVPAWYSDSPIPVNPSGISELDHPSTINIINVGSNVWEVQADNQQIKNISVYDIKGALMMDQHVGKNRLPLINLSQAEKGCYIVEILANDGQHVKEKLMVM